MRKLITKDVFKLARIVKKGNLKSEIADIAEKFSGKDVKAERIGYEVILAAFEACGNSGVEEEVCSLLGDVFEVEDVGNLSIEALLEKFKILAEENNLEVFFKSASQ